MSLEEELAEDIVSGDESLHGDDDSRPKQQANQPKVEQNYTQNFTPIQIKSYIAVLTSALGGLDYASEIQPLPYKLGDEALQCLQDIMKWLRMYDGISNSWEVAVACSESGLVNDLVRILCIWEDYSDLEIETFSGISKDYDRKIANGSLKILEFLTRPIEVTKGILQSQLDNYYILKKQELIYKNLFLTYRDGLVFRAAIKLSLPSLAIPSMHRKQTEHGLIRLVMLFIRNFLMIEQLENLKQYKKITKASEISDNLPNGLRPEDIDVGACIKCFETNLVFPLLLTLSSTMNTTDTEAQFHVELLLDIFYALTKDLRPDTIMTTKLDEPQVEEKIELSSMLLKEEQMKIQFRKEVSSRHSRFGTLFSLKTPDMGRLTINNAGNMLSEAKDPIKAFEKHKTWRVPKQFRYYTDEEVIFPELQISLDSKLLFKKFVGDFIDGALNPFVKMVNRQLTTHIGVEETVLSEQEQRLRDSFKLKYLMSTTWFLRAQRMRAPDDGEIDYALVGAIISEESYRSVTEIAKECINKSNILLAHATLIAYNEWLYLINSMSEIRQYSDNATLLKERMFHKREFTDNLKDLMRNAHKKNPQYIHTVVELMDNMMSTLEKFSEQNMEKVITDKVSRRTKQIISEEQIKINDLNLYDKELNAIDLEDIKTLAQSLSRQRRRTFENIQGKFMNPGMVETYVEYFKNFKDVKEKDLKRGLKYLHRIFFKAKHHMLLYRLDFLNILHLMLSETDGFSREAHIRKHFHQFLNKFMVQFKKDLKKSPTLYVEVLFFHTSSRDISSYAHFLETGKLLEKKVKVIRVSKMLILRDDKLDMNEKISILVAALIDDDKQYLVEWISSVFEFVIQKRILAEGPPSSTELDHDEFPEHQRDSEKQIHPIAIKSEENTNMNSLITEPKLRYILKLANFDLPLSSDEDCIFPASASLKDLVQVTELIKLYLLTPVELPGGKRANDYIRIINLANINNASKDDESDDESGPSNGLGGYAEEGDEFVVGNYSEDEEGASDNGMFDNMVDRWDDEVDGNNDDPERRKGIAKSKGKKLRSEGVESQRRTKKKNSRNRKRYDALPMHDVSGDEDEQNASKSKRKEVQGFVSSKYIVDSDDESDEERDRLFFERELKLRGYINTRGNLVSAQELDNFLNSATATKDIGEQNPEEPAAPEIGEQGINESVNKRNSEALESPVIKKPRVIDDNDEEEEEEEGYDESASDDESPTSLVDKSNTPLTDNEDDEDDVNEKNRDIDESEDDDDVSSDEAVTRPTRIGQVSGEEESSNDIDDEPVNSVETEETSTRKRRIISDDEDDD